MKCNDLYLLGKKLSDVLGDPVRLRQMQKNSKKFGNANACFEICDFIAQGKHGYVEYAKGEKKEA